MTRRTGVSVDGFDADIAPEAGVEEAWAAEVRKRLAELDDGSVKTIPASKFLSDLQAAARGKSA